MALGKPTHLLLAGKNAAPSDFVRSEWIEYQQENEQKFRSSVAAAFSEIDEYAQFVEDLALTADDAEEMDPELVFERFRRAYLVSKSEVAQDGIMRLSAKMRVARTDAEVGRLMRSYRRRLLDEVAHFERLCRSL